MHPATPNSPMALAAAPKAGLCTMDASVDIDEEVAMLVVERCFMEKVGDGVGCCRRQECIEVESLVQC